MNSINRNTILYIGILFMLCSQFGCQITQEGNKMIAKADTAIMLKYYTQQDTITDPGKYAYLYQDLPSDIPQLVQVVQGVMIHIFHAQRYGVQLTEDQKKEVNLRRMDLRLARILELNSQPITIAREPKKKVVGNCRDFSVFMCSVLRYKGIPARTRCGFGTYFIPGKYEDHWICEYWDKKEKHWVQLDPQLDDVQKKAMNISFDSLNMPAGKFLTGGEVYQLCRSGKINPDDCGIADMHGLWFVRGDLYRDLMALNNLPILPWDCNPLMYGKLKLPNEDALDDHIAELTGSKTTRFAEYRKLYDSDPNLRMPSEWKP